MGQMIAVRILLGLLAVVLLGGAAYSLATGKTYLAKGRNFPAKGKGPGTRVAVARADSPGTFWVAIALSVALGIMCLLGAAGVFFP
jgi:hypothetical protein